MNAISRFVCALALGALAVSAVIAAGAPAGGTTTKPADLATISTYVKVSKGQFESLVHLMTKVATDLKARKTPEAAESAKIIEAARDKAVEAEIAGNMGDIIGELSRSFAAAQSKEIDVKEAIDEVLKILKGAPDANKKDDPRIWKDWLAKIEKLIERQKGAMDPKPAGEPVAEQPKRDPQKQQEEITKDSATVAKEMADRAKQNGEDTAPGKENMRNASKSSGSATKNLGDNKPDDAKKDQKKTLDELEKAHDELAKAIDDQQKKDEQETLATIDQKLTEILEKQVNCTKLTKDVYTKRKGEKEYDRPQVVALEDLSKNEGELGGKVGEVRKMLTDEKESVVFPALLQDVGDKMVEVQKRLAEREAGKVTQVTQEEIEETLAAMIDAIRKQMREHQDKWKTHTGPDAGTGSSGPPSTRKPPLIPPIAELKLLTIRQRIINGSTDKLGEAADAETKAKMQKLAADEAKVRDLAIEMDKKITQRQPPAPGDAGPVTGPQPVHVQPETI